MNTQEFTIDDFVEINVFISKQDVPIEASAYTSVQGLFEDHLMEALNDSERLGQYGINVYKIKIGDTLRIHPSKWTERFCKEKGLPLGDDYNFEYRVINMKIDFYSKNSAHEMELPQIRILIYLERI
jgi:hypothetical protein